MITPTGIVVPKLTTFVDGVPIEDSVWLQLQKLSTLPFVSRMALMPDAHVGKGSTVGSVIATDHVIIPAAVGVDIGCGMTAVQLSLKAHDLPESLVSLRQAIELCREVDGKALPRGVESRMYWTGGWERSDVPQAKAIMLWRAGFGALLDYIKYLVEYEGTIPYSALDPLAEWADREHQGWRTR